ncbi:MAG: outer membrane lipoprotein chaperone LolA [Kistimonas sp.]|nr:outer membrane lipoprotein chaperone LolA [Kistimonas sp.]
MRNFRLRGLRGGRIGALSAVLIPALVPLAAAGQSPQAGTVPPAVQSTAAAQLAEALHHIKTLRARFSQQTQGNGRQASPSQGELLLKRPHLFLWKTRPPFSQTLLVRDNQVKLYDQALGQVTLRDVTADDARSPAQLLSGNADAVLRNFTVSLVRNGARQQFTLQSKPGEESALRGLELVFVSGKLEKMGLLDALDARTTIVFTDVQLNQPVSNGAFSLRIPPGTEVIDQRAQPRSAQPS